MTRGSYHWITPVLAVLGLADAIYLAALHLRGEIPPCGGYSGCEQVNASSYSEIFGVPIALLGSVLYLGIVGLSVWRAAGPDRIWDVSTLGIYGLSLSAAIFMVYLTGVEAFVLGAYCYWCLALTAITLVLLGLSVRDLLVKRGGRQAAVPAGPRRT